MRLTECYCATCATTTAHEQPPCLDGHGDDCPEWLCTGCGEAALIGPWSVAASGRHGRLSGRTGTTRHRRAHAA